MNKDRTRMLMDVEFEYPGDKSKHEESVWVPFPVLMNAIREYCDSKMVKLDGTDTAIWNLFVDLNCLDELEDNEEIMEIVKKLYEESEYREEDFEEWVDEYENLNNLGKYAEED